MTGLISVVIPSRNAEATIGRCLAAVFASDHPHFEVIVVDDCSTDDSIAVMKQFPCKLIRLHEHSGASRARNVGAAHSDGDVLFFTDADCLFEKNTLAIADRLFSSRGTGVVVGGTYTCIPYDTDFFSIFQSVFINYSETRRTDTPDYVATHALIIDARIFSKTGGFAERFLPILEDVDFSHRLHEAGYQLLIEPGIQVRHIFDYTLSRSMRNATIKSMYWTIYSIEHRDLLADSGTASIALKTNVAVSFFSAVLLLAAFSTGNSVLLWAGVPALALNLSVNAGLLGAFYRARGFVFMVMATAYYFLLYPLAVAAGALAGVIRYRGVIGALRPGS